MLKRKWFAATLVLASFAHVGFAGAAEPYPTHPVRLVTAGVGTFADLIARHISRRLAEKWGRPVIVENQPAAALTIGTGIVAHAAPDGYTLLVADRSPLTSAPLLYKNLPYDPDKDLRPVTLIARAPALLAINSAVPANTLKEFLDYAQKHQKQMLFASAGNGTMVHLAGALFAKLTHLDFLTVQYRGGTEAIQAMLRGEAQFTFGSLPGILPHATSGQMKALAVASAKRLEAASELPTSAEAGLPEMKAEQWVALMAPAQTRQDIVLQLNHAVGDVLRDQELRGLLKAQGAEVDSGSPEALASFIAVERSRLGKLIESAHISMD